MGKGKLRVRRLTLATGFRDSQGEVDEEDDDEADLILAKEYLDRITELAVASTPAGKGIHVHGVEDRLGFRFWANGSDSDSEEEEILGDAQSMDTAEFVRSAKVAGFSIHELTTTADEVQISPTSQRPFAPEGSTARLIVETMVNRKCSTTPWKGPLPPRRVSPKRTFGDAIANAKVISSSRPSSSFRFSSSKEPVHLCRRSSSAEGKVSPRSANLRSGAWRGSNFEYVLSFRDLLQSI